eukprot:6162376-Prymnesium_polylepis.1
MARGYVHPHLAGTRATCAASARMARTPTRGCSADALSASHDMSGRRVPRPLLTTAFGLSPNPSTHRRRHT